MTAKQIDELLETLKRIASALEMSNYLASFGAPPAISPPSGAGPASMWQCQACRTWVLPGATHACAGKRFIGTAGSYATCGEPGPTGGRCYLIKGHTATHTFATVTNSAVS